MELLDKFCYKEQVDFKLMLKSYAPLPSFLITTPLLMELYGLNLQKELSIDSIFLLPEGESAKTVFELRRCWKAFFKAKIDRHQTVIGLGGGSVSDFTGFAASTYMRGVPFGLVPTTLLSMCDASIGGKTGINAFGVKNLLGTFAEPLWTYIDIDYLQTLPRRDLIAGFAEIIKYGVILDSSFFSFLEEHLSEGISKAELTLVIERCITLKKQVVALDPFDQKGVRALLNFGHTFGHALESMFSHQINHGEAVAIGMSCALHLSLYLGYIGKDEVQRVEQLCQKVGLSIELPLNLSWPQFLKLMKRDKKNKDDTLHFIVIDKIGHALQIKGLSPSIVKKALQNKLK